MDGKVPPEGIHYPVPKTSSKIARHKEMALSFSIIHAHTWQQLGEMESINHIKGVDRVWLSSQQKNLIFFGYLSVQIEAYKRWSCRSAKPWDNLLNMACTVKIFVRSPSHCHISSELVGFIEKIVWDNSIHLVISSSLEAFGKCNPKIELMKMIPLKPTPTCWWKEHRDMGKPLPRKSLAANYHARTRCCFLQSLQKASVLMQSTWLRMTFHGPW